MLDQLVESKSNRKENKKLGEYLLTTFLLVGALFSSAVLYSLFAQDLGMGREAFELSTLIAPIAVTENAPPEVLPKEQPRPQSSQTKSAVATRQTNTLRIEESPIALDKISVAPNTQKSRPSGSFLIRDTSENPSGASAAIGDRGETAGGGGISKSQSASVETVEKTIPPPPAPPIKKSTAEPSEKKKVAVSRGVVNGQATSLPKPPYPPTARAVGASGVVNVQVTIDESGTVISAKAMDGHLLLRAAAEKAAWSAKFKPTLLSDQPVKVTGVIVYKFAAQ